jgi:formylglycine-generating enzyme required for sulfatase activity
LLQRTSRRTGWLVATIGVAIVMSVAGWVAYRGTRVRTATPATAPGHDTSMIVVPAGSYTIGSDTGPPLSRPSHAVVLGAFALGRTEVTVAEYAHFARVTSSAAASRQTGVDSSAPVTGVTWGEASEYCAWRYPRTGRLPTEEEWEAAARGAVARAYPWGDRFDSSAANVGASRDDRSRRIIPVGSFPRGRSPLGFVDLIGNVWEWTSSSPGAYGAAVEATPSPAQRVIRGGAFNTRVELAAAWVRVGYPVDATPEQLGNTGFRCAMSVSSPDSIVRK